MDHRVIVAFGVAVILSLLSVAVAWSVLSHRAPGSAVLASSQAIEKPHPSDAGDQGAEKQRAVEPKRLLWRTLEDPIALFTALLTAFTALLFVATCGLWYMAVRQGSDNKSAIAAANRAADASSDQVALSRIALQSTERAFVVLDPFKMEWVKDRETGVILRWNIQACWRNVGNTPTKFMKNNFSGQNRINKGIMPIDEFHDAKPWDVRRVFLGPSNHMFSAKFPLEMELLWAVKAGVGETYLWGWADYSDVFEGTPRHRTEFCTRLVVHGDPTKDDCTFSHETYGPHNGIDDECFYRPKPYEPENT